MSWERHLRALGRSERTIETYLESADQFDDWIPSGTDLADVTTADVESWIVHLIDTRSAPTARIRFVAVRQLCKWAVAEGEIESDPTATMAQPAQPSREVPIVADDDVRRLLDSITGSGFEDRRDSAILWTLAGTGIRAGELIGMTTASVSLDARTLTVIGKGDRERTVAIGDKVILALDRYERVRRRHRYSMLDAYWLGMRGPVGVSGLRQIVRRRGRAVGIDDLHPHRFRHTFAHRWLAAGGSETGLQTSAGWKSPQMLQRYGASAKAERARAEAERLQLDDF